MISPWPEWLSVIARSVSDKAIQTVDASGKKDWIAASG
jgi:hypothetical protein